MRVALCVLAVDASKEYKKTFAVHKTDLQALTCVQNTPAGVCALAEALASPLCGLRSLQLGRNRGGDAGAAALGAALCGAVISNATEAPPTQSKAVSPQLTPAQAAAQAAERRAATAVAEKAAALVSSTSLPSAQSPTSCSPCPVSPQQQQPPPQQSAATFPTLTSLNLAFNGVGFAGAESLSRALRVNPSLCRLNLRINPIGDAGASSHCQRRRYVLILLESSHSKVTAMAQACTGAALPLV